jgi:hypothetical protein
MNTAAEYDQKKAPAISGARSFGAGCAAGLAGCIVGHPFDTIKLMQQTSPSGGATSLSGWSTAKKLLLRSGGGQRALWAGLAPALAVQVLTSGFLFGAHASISASIAGLLWVPETAGSPTR